MTTYFVIELIKFLLSEGMEFVLTGRFCQDAVEEYFSKQQQLGRRCDNPDLKTFGYNDNTIRIQKSMSCQSGNTRGRYDKRQNWENVTGEKLPKEKQVQRKIFKNFLQCYLCIYIFKTYLRIFYRERTLLVFPSPIPCVWMVSYKSC